MMTSDEIAQETIKQLRAENAALKELHIMQLAAVSTATVQNTETAIKDRIAPDNSYYTTAYGDTCRAVDREMRLRAELAALREDAATLCKIIDHANPGAWSNGNTHPDGYGPDEGEVLMSNLYSPLRSKYARAAHGADAYGNTEENPFEFCTFPDCGCDGARLCQARRGPNSAALNLNLEHRASPRTE